MNTVMNSGSSYLNNIVHTDKRRPSPDFISFENSLSLAILQPHPLHSTLWTYAGGPSGAPSGGRGEQSRQSNIYLNDPIYQVCLGMLLGNSAMRIKSDNNASMSFKRSYKQKAFLYHLFDLFKSFCGFHLVLTKLKGI